MANDHRPATTAIAEQAAKIEKELRAEPYKFGFYHALRLLECAHPHKPRIGESQRPADEMVRLAQEPSLAFAPATLASYKTGKGNNPSQLAVYFFGLLGPNGPLPLHLTEHARDRMRNADDPTFVEFLNIFHNRMLALFYRAWANAQPAVNFDRPEKDRFRTYIGSLSGLGMPSLKNRDEISDMFKLHFTGRLSSQTHNAEGLAAMIKGFYKVPVYIEQFIGEWIKLPEENVCHLGIAKESGLLGVNIVLGERIWECQQKFRIILGPLHYDEFARLLPGSGGARRLRAIVRNYIGDGLGWDVNLVLKKSSVPKMKLGQGALLGFNTWLGKYVSNKDANELTLEYL